MSLRLGIDIDGVLADFRTAFRDAAVECLSAATSTMRRTRADTAGAADAERRAARLGLHREDAELVDGDCRPTSRSRSRGCTA